jgi:hypothetical protein
MSVSTRVRRERAPSATSTIESASSWACSAGRHERAVAELDVHHQPSSPAASFFDRIEAVISGIDSTVPVTSRIA